MTLFSVGIELCFAFYKSLLVTENSQDRTAAAVANFEFSVVPRKLINHVFIV